MLQQLDEAGAVRLLPPPDLMQQCLAKQGVQVARGRRIAFVRAQVGAQEHTEGDIDRLDRLHSHWPLRSGLRGG